MNISVIGGHKCEEKDYKAAYDLGKLIAKEGWVLVCGGKTGVMEAACKGAKENNGTTVGILPSMDTKEGNSFLDIRIPTGLGFARNVLVVRASDIVVAVSGSYGTLSEIAFALSEGKIVLGIDSWDIEGVIKISSAQEAIDKIKKELNNA